MAFDGITVAALTAELSDKLTDGRIFKIAQPEPDALLLTVKKEKSQYRLLLSASASLPLLYLTEANRPNPPAAPNFCMLLRKHIQNGRIARIWQPDLERIVHFEIIHYNELGDLCQKTLTIELMGKHSNLIFQDETGTIIDSIKHIPATVSSVREVLPGRPYFIPESTKKTSPLTVTPETFRTALAAANMPVYKALYLNFSGISPIAASEVCETAGIDGRMGVSDLSEDTLYHLYRIFTDFLEPVRNGRFSPVIYYEKEEPVEFSAVPLQTFGHCRTRLFSGISELLETYYAQKEHFTRMRQKSFDLRRIVQTALEKDYKKYDLQCRQLADTKKREQFQIYGELLTAYGHQIAPGSRSFDALNYYTNETVTIPLDETETPMENAKRYFEKYGKLKRTYEALTEITAQTAASISHLESISTALDMAPDETTLKEIKEELIAFGYLKPHYGAKNRRGTPAKKEQTLSRPLHYLSSDGFHLYVGKNNYQNERLTFQLASGSDWWFHAKGMPGSHVILKAEGKEIPDRAFEEAAMLAAYYSKGQLQDKVEIDYTQRKHLKKVNGGAPGFVIYHTNYSMVITPGTANLKQVE